MSGEKYVPQAWRLSGFYPEAYAKSAAALDSGIDYDDDRFDEYQAHFLADLAAHDREVAAEAWDHCLDEIEANDINTQQAREGNRYRYEEGNT